MLFRTFFAVNCIYATECFLTNVSTCIIVIKQMCKIGVDFCCVTVGSFSLLKGDRK